MFGKKELATAEKEICRGCGCLMAYASKTVERRDRSGNVRRSCSVCHSFQPYKLSYCGKCAPPYDIEEWTQTEVRYYVRQEVRVNKDGTT